MIARGSTKKGESTAINRRAPGARRIAQISAWRAMSTSIANSSQKITKTAKSSMPSANKMALSVQSCVLKSAKTSPAAKKRVRSWARFNPACKLRGVLSRSSTRSTLAPCSSRAANKRTRLAVSRAERTATVKRSNKTTSTKATSIQT